MSISCKHIQIQQAFFLSNVNLNELIYQVCINLPLATIWNSELIGLLNLNVLISAEIWYSYMLSSSSDCFALGWPMHDYGDLFKSTRAGGDR